MSQKITPKNEHWEQSLGKINHYLPFGLIIIGIIMLYLGYSHGNYLVASGFITYGLLGLPLLQKNKIPFSIKLIGKAIVLILISLSGIYMMAFSLNFILILPLIILDRLFA